MNLREIAAIDHAAILSDTATGFAIPLTLTTPSGVQITLPGFASDVGEVLDPESGIQIAGRRATAAFTEDALREAGLGKVEAIADEKLRPWLVTFADATGITRTYKVIQVLRDGDLGSVRCALEAFRNG